MTNLDELIAQATKVGAYAAELERGLEKPGSPRGKDDHLHHAGDDTGRLVTEAYRAHGADAAAQVIEAYLAEFNRQRARDGVPALSAKQVIAHLPWAIMPTGITSDQQAEVCKAFERRNP